MDTRSVKRNYCIQQSKAIIQGGDFGRFSPEEQGGGDSGEYIRI